MTIYCPCVVIIYNKIISYIRSPLRIVFLYLSVQDVATTPWEIPAVTCNPSIPCFSICYERPVDMSTLREMQSCPSFTYVYVRCGMLLFSILGLSD